MRESTYACSVLGGMPARCALSDSIVGSGGTKTGLGAIAVRVLPPMDPRRVGEALRSSRDMRDIFVVGEAERTFAFAAEDESTEGDGVRSWTFFSTFEEGD